MPGAVLFDLDGTLTDTLRDIADAMNRTLRRCGLKTWPVLSYRFMVGDGAAMLARRAVCGHEELAAEVLADYGADYHQHSLHHTRAFPGVHDLLRALQDRGVPLCVLSNKPDEDTRAVVSHFFPDISFALVQGQRPGVPVKPDPAAALHMAETLGMQPKCFWYLGDSGVDMQCAKNAGMRPVGVLWGFRDREELQASGAAHLLREPMGLLTLLDEAGQP